MLIFHLYIIIKYRRSVRIYFMVYSSVPTEQYGLAMMFKYNRHCTGVPSSHIECYCSFRSGGKSPPVPWRRARDFDTARVFKNVSRRRRINRFFRGV